MPKRECDREEQVQSRQNIAPSKEFLVTTSELASLIKKGEPKKFVLERPKEADFHLRNKESYLESNKQRNFHEEAKEERRWGR